MRRRILLPCAALATLVLTLALGPGPAVAFKAHSKFATESFGKAGGCEGTGTGILASGSPEITSVNTTCGTFAVGQPIVGSINGLLPTATITAVGAGTLTVNPPAENSGKAGLSATATPFGNLPGGRLVALHQSSGRLYVLDGVAPGNASPVKIYAFTVSGNTPVSSCLPFEVPGPRGGSSQIVIDNSKAASDGNIYYASAGTGGSQQVFGFNPATCASLPGFPVKAPEHVEGPSKFAPVIRGVAVDPTGSIWLSNARWLERYSSAGVKIDERKMPTGSPTSIDFDAAGDLYVTDGATTLKYAAPNYDEATVFNGQGPMAIAIDRVNGDVYGISNDSKSIQRFDPEEGSEPLETFGVREMGTYAGLAIDQNSGKVYTAIRNGNLIDVFGTIEVPLATTGAASDPGATEATLGGTVRPDGVPLTACSFQWVSEVAFQATGFTDLASGGEAPCVPGFGTIPADSEKHPVSAMATTLLEGSAYRFRLTAENANGGNVGRAVPFMLGAPGVETVGSPFRSATTARLDSRLNPHGLATDYRFEYGTLGPCDSNPCVATPPQPAGAGNAIKLVSQRIEGLQPAITYHYRILADNGGPGGEVAGEDMTVRTRASDAPLSHGALPGPAGSDRAWELVSPPDTSGNPVVAALALSNSGERAIYQVFGGTPSAPAGTLSNSFLAERTNGGWENVATYPNRTEAQFSGWKAPAASDGLETILALNIETGATSQPGAVWRLAPGAPPSELYEMPPGQFGSGTGNNRLYLFSDDGSRALLLLNGSLDPVHPAPAGTVQLYDVSSGAPSLVGLLPGEAVPSCGVQPGISIFALPQNAVRRKSQWLAADGSHAFFASAGNSPGCSTHHLYLRDFAAESTVRIDGPPLSGPECSGAFVKSNPGSAYLWTQARLDPVDTAASCNGEEGGDVYRYDLSAGSYECLTCGSWPRADVAVSAQASAGERIAIAADGSRLYFKTLRHLLPGANEEGDVGLYRLEVVSGDLAYVGPIGEGRVGDNGEIGQGITSDGAKIVFASNSPDLDSLTGSNNGGSTQYYLYDDADRSLACVSCPSDGQAPRDGVPNRALPGPGYSEGVGPNLAILAESGAVAFATPTPLSSADQNTAPAGQDAQTGIDVYEWRDGRQLLVSDGLTNWPIGEGAAPQVAGIAPDGRDLLFLEGAALTPDALDGYRRLYNARIGGGFEFPAPPKPCPLEACQGTPKGAPSEMAAGSAGFAGPGDARPAQVRRRCPKGKRRVRRGGKLHCIGRRHRKADQSRRAR